MASVMDESPVSSEPLVLKGRFVDLFDASLPVLDEKVVHPGEQAFLYDLDEVGDTAGVKVLAAASRQCEEVVSSHNYSFVAKSPAQTKNVMRILLPKEPKNVHVSVTSRSIWDAASRTLLLEFENNPDGVSVSLEW